MSVNKKILFSLLLLFAVSAKAQQKVIMLYPGAAPGSENWSWQENINEQNAWNSKVVYNVTRPTLTVYPADPAVQATGTAVIICPGGGFHLLSIDKEGTDEATWLAKKGVTVFILKYRLEHSLTNDPIKEFGEKSAKKGFSVDKLKVIPLAIADGRAAIAYVRSHAADYKILPNQIGIMGFSAGGTVAVSAAWNYTADNRPDFVGAIYSYLPKSLLKPADNDAPPLFIAAASDDPLNVNELQNTNLYNDWINAKRSAEIHIYAKGGHGFGLTKQNIPTDTWIDRFGDWMNQQGFLKPLSNEKTEAQKNAENWANYQKYLEDLTHNDWPWITKYEAANAQLPTPAPGEKRVVFMGNSITENWGNMDPAYFKDNGYISRGIGGQVSSQMLVRFREDVINLKPVAVVIEAGTNDIAQNRGPVSLQNIYGNIISMAQLAKASGIIPVLSSVLPATEFSWHRGLEPADKIIKLNEMIKSYAEKNHLVYIDYWSAMRNDKNGLKVELAQDALVHPNLAGYKVMEPLAKQGIEEALKRKK
ncbi:MAG: carboxylesterase family protein [Mucilaginibacter sp.]|nr:carboxylesterase family protein [Mucilaginibacter sp.]